MNSGQKRPIHRNTRREMFLAHGALAALALVCALAFIPSTSVLADRVTLLALGAGCALLCWTPLLKHVKATPERAAFVLTAAMFVIYGLARAAGPDEGFSLRFAALPDDEFVVPYSAYVVLFGAILTGPYWWFHRNNWTRSILSGVTLVGFFALVAFSLLRRYYPAGPTDILDPSPLPPLAMKLVEYGCVALLCHAVAARRHTRRLALRLLPGVLLLLWTRHQFIVAPEESE